ncbi:sensor histidine kinase [Lysobacter capsici]|uniref:sensor histidine kinase n=1 Tax=Lysobacter capsici TaxID=435897 RepID=UPI000A6F1AAE|nr:sensor histidine kinase [Lysobacter capsici]
MKAKAKNTQLRRRRVESACAPVVLTVDDAGNAVDTVGDLSAFTRGGRSIDDIVQHLLLLVEGEQHPSETLHAVELDEGRYADVHIVREGELRYFVLHDVSEIALTLQRSQQIDNEIAMAQEKERRRIRSVHPLKGADAAAEGSSLRRESHGLLASLSSEIRHSLLLLSGHLRILSRQCKNDAAAMHSIAMVQNAATQLDALSSNAVVGLGELTVCSPSAGLLEVNRLAEFLQDAFVLQAFGRGVGFGVRVAKTESWIEVDDLALRQTLTNLILHALDGMSGGRLVVSLLVRAGHLEFELEAEPEGFSVERFGVLITTDDLLRSNAQGNLHLAIAQRLLQRLSATVELVSRVEGGWLLWGRLPVREQRSAPDDIELGDEWLR